MSPSPAIGSEVSRQFLEWTLMPGFVHYDETFVALPGTIVISLKKKIEAVTYFFKRELHGILGSNSLLFDHDGK